MPGWIRSRATFANVCSFLALTIALGTGSAYAANTVFSTDIVDGEVKSVDLGEGAVSWAKIAGNAVTTSKINADAITAADIASAGVGADEVLDGSLMSDDLGANAVGGEELQPDAVRGGEIAEGAVDGGEVRDNSLTGEELATNSVSLGDIVGANRTGSISVNSIPNGRCVTIAGTVTGAVVGEVALLSVTGSTTLPAGVTVGAQGVPSAGQVAIKVCNLTGASFAGFTDLPVRVVTFG